MQGQKKIKGKLRIIVLSVFLLITTGVVLLIVYRQNPNALIINAFENTVREWVPNPVLKDIANMEDFVGEDGYCIETRVETEVPVLGDIAINARQYISNNKINVIGDFDIAMILPVTYEMIMDEDSFGITIPFLDERIFCMDYRGERGDGLEKYIDVDKLGNYAKRYFEIMTGLTSLKDNKNAFLQDMIKSLEDVSFEETQDAAADEYAKKCDMYKASISEDKISEIVDIFSENNIFADKYSQYENNEMFSNVMKGQEADIYVGICENRISYIRVVNGSESYEIKKIKADDDSEIISLSKSENELMSIEKTLGGNENEYLFKCDGLSVSAVYDKNEDVLSFRVLKEAKEYDIDIKIKRSDDRIKFETDYFDVGDTYFGGFISFSKDKEEIKIKGEEFNIAKLTEEELGILKNEIYSEIMKVIGW